MSKVPCGGFKLDENFLGMNENDELSLTGGGEDKAYQQLVTDGKGEVRWEDRLAYEDSRVAVTDPDGNLFVKVADEIPSWLSADASVKVWEDTGHDEICGSEGYFVEHNGSFIDSDFYVAVITEDNTEFPFESLTVSFPKKGVYFSYFEDGYTAGIASADSDTPEITWDGNIDMIKKLDEKFLPDMLILYEHEVA